MLIEDEFQLLCAALEAIGIMHPPLCDRVGCATKDRLYGAKPETERANASNAKEEK